MQYIFELGHENICSEMVHTVPDTLKWCNFLFDLSDFRTQHFSTMRILLATLVLMVLAILKYLHVGGYWTNIEADGEIVI